jgi:hypothetical protein
MHHWKVVKELAMNEIEIAKLPEESKLSFLNALQNSQLYEQRLLEAFPLERDSNSEYFHPDTFTNDDKKCYSEFKEIFDGKNWNEINLSVLYKKNFAFSMFNANGRIYYMPAFLKFLYDQRHFFAHASIPLDAFYDDITKGISVYKMMASGRYESSVSYDPFDRLTLPQSKLVALFIADLAILLPEQYAEQAQRALKDYWGKYLIL